MDNKLIISIILSVLVTAIVAGGGVYLLQKSGFEKEKQQLQQQINNLNNQLVNLKNKTNNCTSEGNILSLEEGSEGLSCCEGLNQKVHYDLINNECVLLADAAICIDCPNGQCGLGENNCNCPEDCQSDSNSIQDAFQKSDQYGYFGTINLIGYLDIETRVCNPNDMCGETVEYASLVITETAGDLDSSLIYDFIGRNQGNSFIEPNAVGLGCYQENQNRIYSSNHGDDGWVDNIISGVSLEKLLLSDKTNQVKIQMTKPIFTSGSGAPDCYSHFRNFKIF